MKNIITIIKNWYQNLPEEKPWETSIRLTQEDLEKQIEEIKNKKERKNS